MLLLDCASVMRLNATDQLVPVADLSSIGFAGPTFSLAAGALGRFDGSLFLLAAPDQVVGVSPAGDLWTFAPDGETPSFYTAMVGDPYGAFGGQLFLADHHGQLHSLSDDGAFELFATDVGGFEHGSEFSSGGGFGQYLYVVDTNGQRILRLSPDHQPGDAAPVWLDLSPFDVSPVSMAMSREGPFGDDVMYITNTAGRSRAAIVRHVCSSTFRYAAGVATYRCPHVDDSAAPSSRRHRNASFQSPESELESKPIRQLTVRAD